MFPFKYLENDRTGRRIAACGLLSGDDILNDPDEDSGKKEIRYCTFTDLLPRFKGSKAHDVGRLPYFI